MHEFHGFKLISEKMVKRSKKRLTGMKYEKFNTNKNFSGDLCFENILMHIWMDIVCAYQKRSTPQRYWIQIAV